MKKILMFSLVIIICVFFFTVAHSTENRKLEINRNVYIGTTYVSQNLSKSVIDSSGLVLLPIIVLSGHEENRRPFIEIIDRAIITHFPKYMGFEESQRLLSQQNLVRDYNEAIRIYRELGVLDLKFLKEFSDIEGYNYFLFLEAIIPNYKHTSKIDRSQFNDVTIFGIIWSAFGNEIVWEGHAELSGGVFLNEERYWPETPFSMRVNYTTTAFVQNLLNSIED